MRPTGSGIPSGHRRTAALLTTIVATLALGACGSGAAPAGQSTERDEQAAPRNGKNEQAATPTPEPKGVEFDFCEAVDIETVEQLAARFPRYLEPSGPVGLSYRGVSTTWDPSTEKVTEISELCDFGFGTDSVVLGLQAFPVRTAEREQLDDHDVPLPDLGKGAFFQQSSDFFTLGAPAADSYLLLTGHLTTSSEPADAEQALRAVLESIVSEVPANATLPGDVAGEFCAPLADPVADAIGQVDYSRLVEVGKAATCSYASLESGANAIIQYRPGDGAEYEPSFQDPVDGIENAWRSDGSTTAVRGADLVSVQLMGAGGSDEDDGNGDFTKDDALTAAAVDALLS